MPAISFPWHRTTPDPRILNELRARWPLLAAIDDPDWVRLVALATQFLQSKNIVGAGDFEINASIRLGVALLACLPILHLGLGPYRDFVDVIIYPDRFIVERELIDEHGLVHAERDVLSGEAMAGGPVVLAWSEVLASQDGGAYNVVIHEFVHKLDMAQGEADGVPIAARRCCPDWEAIIEHAWLDFREQLDRLEQSFPPDMDPDGEQAMQLYGQLALDPYAAVDRAEFLAVSAEAYFANPAPLRAAYPELHAAMQAYFSGAILPVERR